MENQGIWTLDKIAYAIKNNLEAGLKTTANFPFSMEQLRHQVIARRLLLIQKYEGQGLLDGETDLYQEMNCIKLDCENLSLCCRDTKDGVTHFIMPQYHSIIYLGKTDYEVSFKRYITKGRKYDKYKDRRLTTRPYVEIRQHNGENHVFVFNSPGNLKFVSVSLILKNPLDINKYSNCEDCVFDIENDEFPVPGWMVDEIINSITSEWSSYYYRFQGGQKSNSQTSLA